jgi:hypothetical protein
MLDPFYIRLYQKNPDTEAIIRITKELYDLQQKGDYKTLDFMISKINFHRLEDVIIMVMLRCNYPIRDKLKSWNSFFDKANKKFEGSNKLEILKY